MEFVVRHAEAPFAWGRHDCALMAAGAVEAMTGIDLAAGVRGRYRTPRGAARVMRRLGYRSLDSLLMASLGPTRPLLAGHRGDICRHEGALGVLMADHGLFVGRAPDDPETAETRFGARIRGHGWVRIPRPLLDPLSWHVPFEPTPEAG